MDKNMNDKSEYIELKDLEIYRLSRELSKLGWKIYSSLNFEAKKLMGDQFIRAVDSVGANISEGYSRFHYLDKLRFYYNSRASLAEAIDHWAELLNERNLIPDEKLFFLKSLAKTLQIKLNNYISAIYQKSKTAKK